MQLRHISPRSSDWMDAMDEGAGGAGLGEAGARRAGEAAPGDAATGTATPTGAGARQRGRSHGSRLRADVGLEVGDEDLGRAILGAPGLGQRWATSFIRIENTSGVCPGDPAKPDRQLTVASVPVLART